MLLVETQHSAIYIELTRSQIAKQGKQYRAVGGQLQHSLLKVKLSESEHFRTRLQRHSPFRSLGTCLLATSLLLRLSLRGLSLVLEPMVRLQALDKHAVTI